MPFAPGSTAVGSFHAISWVACDVALEFCSFFVRRDSEFRTMRRLPLPDTSIEIEDAAGWECVIPVAALRSCPVTRSLLIFTREKC